MPCTCVTQCIHCVSGCSNFILQTPYDLGTISSSFHRWENWNSEMFKGPRVWTKPAAFRVLSMTLCSPKMYHTLDSNILWLHNYKMATAAWNNNLGRWCLLPKALLFCFIVTLSNLTYCNVLIKKNTKDTHFINYFI